MTPERTSLTLSRRRFLGTTGAGFAAALLAGGVLPSGFGKVVMAQDGGTEFHAAYPYLDPGSGGHFNSFVTNAILTQLVPGTVYGDLILQPLGMYYWATGEWLPLLATEWSFISTGQGTASPVASAEASPVEAAAEASPATSGGEPAGADAQPLYKMGEIDLSADTFEVKLRQGANWSDGTPITSKDVVDTLWLRRLMLQTEWKYLDDVTAVDDYTVHCHMSLPSTEVERYVIRIAYPRPSSVYGEWADKARDLYSSGKTNDDPELKQLLDQFTDFRPDGNYPVSGPYQIDPGSITNAQMTLNKNDKAWNAENAKFDRIINYNGETDTISAVVLSKEIDYATHGFSVATEKQMLDSGIRVVRPPVYSGPAIYINYGTLTEFADERVRQAIAMAVNRAQNGQIALGESGIAQKYMTGMSDNLVPQWMPQDAIDALNQYEYDQDKAASLLQEVGWTKDGDTWKTPDGKDASYDLTFPAEFADWSAAGQDLAEQLTDFGIQINPRAITYTQQPIDLDKGDFQLAIQGWGSSNNPHPHYSYAQAFFTHNTQARLNGGSGIDFPLTQDTKVAGEVDLDKLTVDSAEGLDINAQKKNVTTIAEVFNELLPIVPLFERYGNNAALEGVRVKEWPADGDLIYKNSPYADGIPVMLMYTGWLEPVEGGQ
ncbi:MAG TPA: ABC transporter substrate-binding protein [Thermomicrobiales bacterium]|nr:ABC transporter substrate-binding protein [Thermomicrobiales bacterium]